MANSTQKTKKKIHFGYFVVFALILTSFGPLSLGLSCAGIFYPAVSAHLGVGKGILSYYTSFIWIASVVSLPVLGKLLAKADARICIASSVMLIVLAFVWLSFTSSLISFYVGAFIIGIATAMLLFLAPSTLVNRWFVKRSGFFVGLIVAFTGVGGAVWSSVGGILINNIGWSATYLVFALISLLTLPAAVFFIRTKPSDKGLSPFGADGIVEETKTEEAITGIEAKTAFKMPIFYVMLFICFAVNFGLYTGIMIPSYINSIPIGAQLPLLGATAASVVMIGQTVSKVALGYVGERRPYLGSIVALFLGLVGLFFLQTFADSSAAIYGASLAFGVYYGIANVMMPIFTRKIFGDRDYPIIYSRISMSASISNIVAALVWGTVIDATGSFSFMFAGVGIVLLATVAVLICLARKGVARNDV